MLCSTPIACRSDGRLSSCSSSGCVVCAALQRGQLRSGKWQRACGALLVTRSEGLPITLSENATWPDRHRIERPQESESNQDNDTNASSPYGKPCILT